MRRRSVLAATGVAAVVAVAGSGAFACADLATLNLSALSGMAGARITATGAGYSTAAPVLPVVLRWNGTEGPELARVAPDAKGEIRAQFTIPEGPPGYYVVVGVQKDAAGADRVGTPSRASYQILGPGGVSVVDAPAPTVRRPAPTTTAASPVPSTSSTLTVPPTSVARPAELASPPLAVADTDEHGDGPPALVVAVALLLLGGVAVSLRRHAGSR